LPCAERTATSINLPTASDFAHVTCVADIVRLLLVFTVSVSATAISMSTSRSRRFFAK
jgi:hypothetical protein